MLDEKPEPINHCPDGRCQNGWHFYEEIRKGEYAIMCQCGEKRRSVME
jgi:hypothetical protein